MDILILEVGGNLYDAVSIGVKAALHSTTIPRVKIATIDGGQPELEITDDPLDGCRLNVTQSPILVTMCRIGTYWDGVILKRRRFHKGREVVTKKLKKVCT